MYRREAARPNEIWQADHCLLPILVKDGQGKSGRPWLTVIEDDKSRAIAGYRLSWSAPSAIQTALTLRQAIWRKEDVVSAFAVERQWDCSRAPSASQWSKQFCKRASASRGPGGACSKGSHKPIHLRRRRNSYSHNSQGDGMQGLPMRWVLQHPGGPGG